MVMLGLALLVSSCGSDAAISAPSESAPEAETPEGVVESFYRWYLGYPGNAMADGAYQSSEYLSEGFIQEVDQAIASFERGSYDLFLCAQDVPADFAVGAAVVSGDEANVVVDEIWNPDTDYELIRQLDVSLQQIDGVWLIAGIACPAPEATPPAPESSMPVTPESTVMGFYDWYLSYAREVGNPLVDGAYRSSDYLDAAFVQEIDQIVASFDQGGFDPFLCAQDLPGGLALDDATASGDIATVTVREIWNADTEYELVYPVEVALRRDGDAWKITAIMCPEPEAAAPEPDPSEGSEPVEPAPVDGWSTFQDDGYGFRLQHPADWAFQEVELRYPELDAPVVRIVHFLPQEWADQMNAGGRPDPNNVIVAPLGVEVSVGSAEEYRQRYGEPAQSEQVEINGYAVTVEQDTAGDMHMVRYVFQHPGQSDLWVTLVDQISGFSVRAEGNEDVMATLEQILYTFAFTQ
jgi:hypothetical protein